MKVLALESSAAAASCALLEDGKLTGEFFCNISQTHSQTLMPLTEQLLLTAGLTLPELDLLAVSAGPGSFTGLRIAMSAVKGMAYGANLPCMGVSTLEALAWNLRGFEGIAAAVMDARCSQVYTALFTLADGMVVRLTEDAALTIDELGKQLKNVEKPIFLVGDGADLCYNALSEAHSGIRLAPEHLRFQKASSVAALAISDARAGKTVCASELVPSYLRLPQAQRQLLAQK